KTFRASTFRKSLNRFKLGVIVSPQDSRTSFARAFTSRRSPLRSATIRAFSTVSSNPRTNLRGSAARFPSSDVGGNAIRPAIYRFRPSGKVVKVFPSGIVTEGPPRVNGKNVPFAQFRKGSGISEQRARLNKLFLATCTCNLLIIKSLFALRVTPSGIPDALFRTSSLVLTRRDHLKIDSLKKSQLVDTSSTRRSPRIRLQVPIFLRGTDVSGAEFIELTKTLNISSTGACITSTHILRP